MSVYRVITRIIPLNSSESTFEPASFEALTDGSVGEVKVLNLTEPQSGMKYRIERIEYVQNVGPGETVDSVNVAYAEKLKKIPGFVQLKANDVPLNPYDKSFQLTLPKVLSGKTSEKSSNTKFSRKNKSSDSFKISVVKNYNFNKPNLSPTKKARASFALSKYEKEDFQNDAKSLKGFKTKYPSYLSKKIKNSVWRNKNKSSPTKNVKKSPKCIKNSQSFFSGGCSVINNTSESHSCPASSYVEADKDIDSRKFTDVRPVDKEPENIKASKTNNSLVDGITESNYNDICSIDDEEKTDTSLDLFDDLEYGDLIINVPEATNSCSPKNDFSKNNGSFESLNTSSVNGILNNSAITDDDSVAGKKNNCSLISNQSENDAEESSICNTYLVLEEHPLYKLLMSLKKYFVNGECLICGFIPTDINFNASVHMESHISSNSFVSCFKCACCGEKFSSPRNLYEHALSRDKSYKYTCTICLLKFKRKHYLMRHTAKSH